MEKYNLSTRAVHAGQEPEKWSSFAVVPPISLATTFQQPYPAKPVKYEYSRSGNPTRDSVEEALASLENAKYGLTFSSGLAAINTIIFRLNAGDNIISADDVYGGTGRLFRAAVKRLNATVDFVDISNVDNIIAAVKKETKIVWLETPTNPTLRLCDIDQTVKRIRAMNRPDILICVDSTFMTPVFQNPLKFGVDLVLHSLTKYINGHSDVVMGALMTNNQEIYEELKFLQNAMGSVPSPFDCYLVNRGLKTLQLRMERHQSNALKIAKYLESHPKVEKVIYPGLPSHDQYELCLKQCSGFSGMLSFYPKGTEEQTVKFTQNCKLFTLAESLGAVESLIEIPSLMTHASVPAELRKKLGITDNLIRLSVGIENVDDLIADLENSFKLI